MAGVDLPAVLWTPLLAKRNGDAGRAHLGNLRINDQIAIAVAFFKLLVLTYDTDSLYLELLELGKFEDQLVSDVETYGARNWGKVAVNVPGRNEIQCRDKWRKMSKKAATTASGAWTVEEEKKLVSAVETFGTTSWTNIAADVPGRSENQCRSKWWNISRKAGTTASGHWTGEEEKKLAAAVETYGGRNWDKIAEHVQGRNAGIDDDPFSGNTDADLSSGSNKAVEDVGDSMPSAETTTDGDTSRDEPPVKRRRFDWI
jgi:hypothetical protein